MSENNEGKPLKDGSGRGVRANRGRGGCEPPKDKNYFGRWGTALGIGRKNRNRRT